MRGGSSSNHKVAVITGASAGVGRSTAQEFAKHGYKVAILAREPHRLESAVQEMENLGSPKALGIPTDIADSDAVEIAVERIENELGPIDIWVNNAMATIFSPMHKVTPREFKRATEVTYLGSVYGTISALSRMRERNRGVIVQVGSALAYRAIPLQAPYCGAKFALRGFVDSLRVELLHEQSDIHITMVQLPALNTPQFSWAETKVKGHPMPVPPIFQPEVAARAIYWAAHNKRREVLVGRPTVVTIIFNKLFPGLADKYLAVMGFSTQIAPDIPAEENRPGNLFVPVKGGFSAHGVFDKNARSRSPQFEFEKIPVLNILTNLIFAFVHFLSIIPGFIKTVISSKKARKIMGL